MPLRTFTDDDDIAWEVWDVIPRGAAGMGVVSEEAGAGRAGAGHVAPAFRDGWLAFRCTEGEQRRLAPIPSDWLEASAAQLGRYCQLAFSTTQRRA